MSTKHWLGFGVIAALVLAFGAVSFGGGNGSVVEAGFSGTASNGGSIASGGTTTATFFPEDDIPNIVGSSAITVSAVCNPSCTGSPTVTFSSITVSGLTNVPNILAGNGTATLTLSDAEIENLDPDATSDAVTLVVTIGATCPTLNTLVTVTATQADVPIIGDPQSQSTTVVCNPPTSTPQPTATLVNTATAQPTATLVNTATAQPTATLVNTATPQPTTTPVPPTSTPTATSTPQGGLQNTIRINKVDQFGNSSSATFSLQVLAPNSIWIEVARISGSGTTCVVPAATQPAAGSGCYTPNTVTLDNGTYRVVELTTPGGCTLVEVRDGNGGVMTQGGFGNILIPEVTLPAYIPSATFTFVNSCAIAGSPSASASSVTVVIGGSSFGLTNTRNVEIYPMPGSDDDARVDIRIRDSNNNAIENAHVTVMIDKGTLAMRTDTATPNFTGYDVVEPGSSNFGTALSGDSCDQVITQSSSSGTVSYPYITNSRMIQDGFTNSSGIISACVYVNPFYAPGITPGTITGTVIVESPTNPWQPGVGLGIINSVRDFIMPFTIQVVGPPASVTVAASPASLNCGEKSTITITVRDSAGQNVSDHTPVEVITNWGGVVAGTGSTLGWPGTNLVGPLASGAAETFNGIATAFLLTSTEHVGPYEVVASAGGALGGGVDWFSNLLSGTFPGQSSNIVNGDVSFNLLQSWFGYTPPNTPIVTSQVTVNCDLPGAAAPAPAPSVTAPRTGTGPILPPNTGDAGLASSSSWALFGIAGAAVFALAGLASLKFARR